MLEDFSYLQPGSLWPHLNTAGVKKVYLVGSTGVGKTTLFNYIKAHVRSIIRPLDFPLRYITRPPRKNDDLEENKHVTSAVFDSLIKQNKIEMHWQRDLGREKFERYGFAYAKRQCFTYLFGEYGDYA